jgi:hypothetical protein
MFKSEHDPQISWHGYRPETRKSTLQGMKPVPWQARALHDYRFIQARQDPGYFVTMHRRHFATGIIFKEFFSPFVLKALYHFCKLPCSHTASSVTLQLTTADARHYPYPALSKTGSRFLAPLHNQ